MAGLGKDCPHCRKTFSTSSSTRRHIRKIHSLNPDTGEPIEKEKTVKVKRPRTEKSTTKEGKNLPINEIIKPKELKRREECRSLYTIHKGVRIHTDSLVIEKNGSFWARPKANEKRTPRKPLLIATAYQSPDLVTMALDLAEINLEPISPIPPTPPRMEEPNKEQPTTTITEVQQLFDVTEPVQEEPKEKPTSMTEIQHLFELTDPVPYFL